MPVVLEPLTSGQLSTRLAKLTDHLDYFGDVRVTDHGERQPRRRIEWFLAAPGVPGVHDEVVGLYRETYDRDGADWRIAKYTYEYLDKLHQRRLAYHLHPMASGGPLVPHAHCGVLEVSVLEMSVFEEEDRDHFRATEVDLTEANDEFMTLYASGLAPDCHRFRPLAVPR